VSTAVLTAAALALAIGAAAFITSTAKISQAPRVWLAKRDSRAGRWFFYLVSCPLCTATWMALAATAIYRPWLVHRAWPLDYLVTSLAITATAMLPVLVIRKAIEK
jgi:hypothetical protein